MNESSNNGGRIIEPVPDADLFPGAVVVVAHHEGSATEPHMGLESPT